MRLSIWVFAILSCIAIVSGCHPRHSRRRKREYTGDVTVTGFFPTCIVNGLAPIQASPSTILTWDGPVSVAVFHSTWYQNVNETCGYIGDTAECWVNNAANYIIPGSPTLGVVQDCIRDYYDEYYDSTVRKKRDAVRISDVQTASAMDNPSCPYVTRETIVNRLEPNLANADKVIPMTIIAMMNQSRDLTDSDLAFTFEHVTDSVKFGEEELFCPKCTCDDLADGTIYLGQFSFPGGSCNACWYARFAASMRSESPFKALVSQIIFEEAGFTLDTQCSGNAGIDFTNEALVADLLSIRISCTEERIHVEMSSRGVVLHGNHRADEIIVCGPNTCASSADNAVSDQCVGKTKAKTNKGVITMNFGLLDCDTESSINGTHEIYTFVVRNRPPREYIYASGMRFVRRVDIHRQFTCAYPVSSPPSKRDITPLQNSIYLPLQAATEPLKVTMAAYRDQSLLIPFAVSDSTVFVTDPIWIVVSHNGHESYVIDTPTCWVEDASEEATPVLLVQNGCPYNDLNAQGSLDGAQDLITCSLNVASFMFNSLYCGEGCSLRVNCNVNVYTMSPACRNRNCDSTQGVGRRRRRLSGHLELVVQPVLRQCEEPCHCDHSCGCDNSGNALCYCDSGYVLDTDGQSCIVSP